MTQTKPSSRILSMLLILCLVITSIMFTNPSNVYAGNANHYLTNPTIGADKVDGDATTYNYRVDTGSVSLWKNSAGTWVTKREGQTLKPGSTVNLSVNLAIPQSATITQIFAYDMNKAMNSNFGFPKDTSRLSAGVLNQSSYNDTFKDSFTKVSIKDIDRTGDNVKINYSLTLDKAHMLDLKSQYNDLLHYEKTGNTIMAKSIADKLTLVLGDANGNGKPDYEDYKKNLASFVEGYVVSPVLIIEYTMSQPSAPSVVYYFYDQDTKTYSDIADSVEYDKLAADFKNYQFPWQMKGYLYSGSTVLNKEKLNAEIVSSPQADKAVTIRSLDGVPIQESAVETMIEAGKLILRVNLMSGQQMHNDVESLMAHLNEMQTIHLAQSWGGVQTLKESEQFIDGEDISWHSTETAGDKCVISFKDAKDADKSQIALVFTKDGTKLPGSKPDAEDPRTLASVTKWYYGPTGELVGTEESQFNRDASIRVSAEQGYEIAKWVTATDKANPGASDYTTWEDVEANKIREGTSEGVLILSLFLLPLKCLLRACKMAWK